MAKRYGAVLWVWWPGAGGRGSRTGNKVGEKKSGSKNGHNNCGVTSVRGGPGGGGEWTLAERGVSTMIVGPSATLLESWLGWELGGEGELGVGVGSGTWKPASSDDVCKLPPMCCQLAGLGSPNWALLAGPPARCLKIPRQSKNRPDKCTSRSAFQEHDASLLWNQQFAAPDSGTQVQERGQMPLDMAAFRSDS